MYKQHFLKFADEEQAVGALQGVSDAFINVIGELRRQDGSTSPGFHVNLSIPYDLPSNLSEYEIFPENPKVVFYYG